MGRQQNQVFVRSSGEMSSDQVGQPSLVHEPKYLTGLRGMAVRAGGFLWWLITGFGLFAFLWKGKAARFKIEEVVVYTVPRAFYLWALILTGFIASAVVRHSPAYIRVAEVWGWIYL